MSTPFPPVCLSIGCSASYGGSGIQADLKTFTALSCYGASAVTAVVAQNFSGITDSQPLSERSVRAQIDAVLADLPVTAVKIGLCPTVATVKTVARWLGEHPKLHVVLDPVAADGRGIPMLPGDVVKAICDDLMPRATISTPNRFEAALFSGMEECLTADDMAHAARLLMRRCGSPVVVTGGLLAGRSVDVLAALDGISHFDAPAHKRGKVNGSGCAHSAAIAAGLARGESLRESIMHAKLYVSAAIGAAPALPNGRSTLWHGVTVREQSVMEHPTGVFSIPSPG